MSNIEMYDVQNAMALFVMGVGIMILILLALFLYRVLPILATWLERKFLDTDDSLAEYGKNPLIREMNRMFTSVAPLVDSSDDKAIVLAMKLLHQYLPVTTERLTPQQLADGVSEVLRALGQLTDGVSEIERRRLQSVGISLKNEIHTIPNAEG